MVVLGFLYHLFYCHSFSLGGKHLVASQMGGGISFLIFHLCWCFKLPLTFSFPYLFGNFDTNKLATRFVGVEKWRLVVSAQFFRLQALFAQQRRNNQ
jgi:hypothetical protein